MEKTEPTSPRAARKEAQTIQELVPTIDVASTREMARELHAQGIGQTAIVGMLVDLADKATTYPAGAAGDFLEEHERKLFRPLISFIVALAIPRGGARG